MLAGLAVAAGLPSSRGVLAAGRAVTADQVGGSIREYLDAVSDETGVKHAADRPFADRSVVATEVNLTPEGARHAVARTYRLTWLPPGKLSSGWLLYESAGDRKARVGARAAASRRGLARLRRRWQEVRELLAMSPSARARRATDGDRLAEVLNEGGGDAWTRFYFDLPESLLGRLWAGGAAHARIADLPPAEQARARGFERAQPRMRMNGRVLSSDVVRQGTVALRFGGTLERPTVCGDLRFGNGGGQVTNLLYVEAGTRQPPEERRREDRFSRSKKPADPRFDRKLTLRDPGIHTTPQEGVEQGERPPRAQPLAHFLKEIARQSGIPVIAECDYHQKDPKWLRQQWWLGGDIVNEPVTHALDLLCSDFEYEWEFTGSAIVLRPRDWYLEPTDRGSTFPF